MQIVPPGLEHVDLLPQAAGAGSLVGVGGRGDSQHLQRTVLHCFQMGIRPEAAAFRAELLFRGKSPRQLTWGNGFRGAEWKGKSLTPPIISLHRALLQPKITFQTNVCAEAGGVTEDAPSHMCREITVKAAVTKKCVCLGVSRWKY